MLRVLIVFTSSPPACTVSHERVHLSICALSHINTYFDHTHEYRGNATHKKDHITSSAQSGRCADRILQFQCTLLLSPLRHTREVSAQVPLRHARGVCTSLICVGCAGEPLGLERGGPVRMIVPHAHGFKSVKWLQHITLTNDYRASDTYASLDDVGNDPSSHLKTYTIVDDPRHTMGARTSAPIASSRQEKVIAEFEATAASLCFQSGNVQQCVVCDTMASVCCVWWCPFAYPFIPLPCLLPSKSPCSPLPLHPSFLFPFHAHWIGASGATPCCTFSFCGACCK